MKELNDYLYYKEDGNPNFGIPDIKIYHGDCLEIMPLLKIGNFDLTLCDPPYEAEAHTQQRRVKREGGVMEIESLEFPAITEELRNYSANSIAMLSNKWILTFCQIEASHIWRKSYEDNGLIYKRTCIWVKPDGMPQYSGDRPGMGYETLLAMHTNKKSVWNGGGVHGVFTYNKNDNGGQPNKHPTTKPRPLIRKLISLFSNQYENVFDPFLGSGTTLVACKELKRNGIGIEINEKYCAIAKTRLMNTQVPFI